ncbi:MAG: hypoxanthine phosphoribosyltransferase [Bacteriovoracaceae bacterium]|nr:hypoxanthine phosphoribosyltransferase [Bacteriovoracaceae bacterium]
MSPTERFILKISTYISEEELENRVKDLGAEISRDYEGKTVHLICVMSGAFMFCADLARYINVPVHLDFIDASSVKDGVKSKENFHIRYPLRNSIEGKDVIVLEDIVDTGVTLSSLLTYLQGLRPQSLKLASLLYKPAKVEYKVKLAYYGFEIEDFYVVGYGMDYNGEYRALPFIGNLEIASSEKE